MLHLKRVRQVVRALKRDFPLDRPVCVRTFAELYDGPHRLYGTCHLRPSGFAICLARNDDVSVMIDTLWHEWTHALLWPRCRYRHSRDFWNQYGEIYRKYLD